MLRRCASRVSESRLLLAGALALTSFGCPTQDLAPLEPCTVSGVSADVPVDSVDSVDLLFVIDDSSSMEQEQDKLAEQLPELVRILTSGKYDPSSPKEDFQPVRDLHLGVVSTNMGANGTAIGFGSCDDDRGQGAGWGDDGVLIQRSRSCDGFVLPGGARYLSYVPGPTTSPEQVAEQFECIAALGIEGCGFEQQLEAMFKALAPNDVSFAGGRGGHGNEKNQGFLREEAVLAIIHVSDEEDCSITEQGTDLFIDGSDDPNVLIPASAGADAGRRLGLNLRCAFREDTSDLQSRAERAGMIHPIERYVDGLRALKPTNPERVIFGAIVGIPDGTEGMLPEQILQHQDMRFAAVPGTQENGELWSAFTRPRQACANADGRADPAVRFLRVAQAFGEENSVVRSICADSYEGALKTIIDKISKQLTGACLPRPLQRSSDGIVECNVVELLQPGVGREGCDPARGREFVEERDVGNGVVRTVCKINQVAIDRALEPPFKPAARPLPGVDARVGWFYDDFTEAAVKGCKVGEQQRISFNPKLAEPENSTLRFECFQPVVRRDTQARGKDAVNSPCSNADQCAARSDEEAAVLQGTGFGLICDGPSSTCQIPCEADSNCPSAWVCATDRRVCVNPTCPPPNER